MDKQQALKYIKSELDLIGLGDHTLGSSMLEFVSNAYDICGGDTRILKSFLNMPTRAVNGFPLSAINLNEFERDSHGIRRNKRYDAAFQDPVTGKYIDCKGIGFIDKTDEDHIKYGTNGEMRSNIEIHEFPYYPKATLVKEQ